MSEAGQAAPVEGGQAAPAAAAEPQVEVQPQQASAPPQDASAKWTDSLSPEMKDYVANKGFQDPASVLDSYVNLEKLRGVPDDRLLKLPEKADDPAWRDVYKKLGAPDNASDYGIKTDLGDESFNQFLGETFKDAGISLSQSQLIMEKLEARMGENSAASDQAYQAKVQQEEMNLKKEWGQAYHQNIAQAQGAAREFGIDEAAVDALEQVLGFDGVMKLMSNIGSRLGEDSYVRGGQNRLDGAMTPQQAQSRIQAMRKDHEFNKRYLAGDMAAKEEMERLHSMAYPGT